MGSKVRISEVLPYLFLFFLCFRAGDTVEGDVCPNGICTDGGVQNGPEGVEHAERLKILEEQTNVKNQIIEKRLQEMRDNFLRRRVLLSSKSEISSEVDETHASQVGDVSAQTNIPSADTLYSGSAGFYGTADDALAHDSTDQNDTVNHQLVDTISNLHIVRAETESQYETVESNQPVGSVENTEDTSGAVFAMWDNKNSDVVVNEREHIETDMEFFDDKKMVFSDDHQEPVIKNSPFVADTTNNHHQEQTDKLNNNLHINLKPADNVNENNPQDMSVYSNSLGNNISKPSQVNDHQLSNVSVEQFHQPYNSASQLSVGHRRLEVNEEMSNNNPAPTADQQQSSSPENLNAGRLETVFDVTTDQNSIETNVDIHEQEISSIDGSNVHSKLMETSSEIDERETDMSQKFEEISHPVDDSVVVVDQYEVSSPKVFDDINVDEKHLETLPVVDAEHNNNVRNMELSEDFTETDGGVSNLNSNPVSEEFVSVDVDISHLKADTDSNYMETTSVNHSSALDAISVFLDDLISKLPSSVLYLLKSTSFGLSPSTALIFYAVISCVFFTCMSYFCKSRQQHKTHSSHDAQHDNQQKSANTDHTTHLIAEVELLRTKVLDLEAHSENSAMQISQISTELQRAKKKRDDLELELSVQCSQVNELSNTVAMQSQTIYSYEQQNQSLQTNLQQITEQYIVLQTHYCELESALQQFRTNQYENQSQVHCLMEEITVLQAAKDQALLDAERWSERAQQLSSEVQNLQCEQKSSQQLIAEYNTKLSILRNSYSELKLVESDMFSCTQSNSDNNVNAHEQSRTIQVDAGREDVQLSAKTELVETLLKNMADVSKVSSQLKAIEQEKCSLERALTSEIELRLQLQDEVEQLKVDYKKEVTARQVAEEHAKTSALKFDVLSTCYSDEQQIKNDVMLDLDNKSVQKNEKMDLVQSHVSREEFELLKTEKQKLEMDLRKEIAVQEKKAHECWMTAKQREREVSEYKAETQSLKHKINELQSKLNNLVKSASPPPLTFESSRSGDCRSSSDGGLSSDWRVFYPPSQAPVHPPPFFAFRPPSLVTNTLSQRMAPDVQRSPLSFDGCSDECRQSRRQVVGQEDKLVVGHILSTSSRASSSSSASRLSPRAESHSQAGGNNFTTSDRCT